MVVRIGKTMRSLDQDIPVKEIRKQVSNIPSKKEMIDRLHGNPTEKGFWYTNFNELFSQGLFHTEQQYAQPVLVNDCDQAMAVLRSL